MTDIDISAIKIGDRLRKDVGNISELAASIDEIGLLHPIVINEKDELVAGYRRIQAYKCLGRNSIPYTRINIDDLRRGEYDENVVKEAFTISELVAIKRAVKETRVGHRPSMAEEQSSRNNNIRNFRTFPKGSSSKIAGKIGGYSARTIEKAEIVVQAAEKNPKLFMPILEKVDAGTMKVDRAYKKVLREIYRQEASGNAPKIDLPERVKLVCSRFQDSTELDESVDLIFSDPPYTADALPLYMDVAKLAMRVLKPGGSFVVYAGHHMLPDIMNSCISAGLRYWWTLALWHQGASATVYGRQVLVGWKPMVWCVKGNRPNCKEFMSDRLDMTKPPEKLAHDWEQGIEEARYVIEHLTYANQVVADYTAGSGTTGIASLSAGRYFVGYEVDSTNFAIMQSRIAKYHEPSGSRPA